MNGLSSNSVAALAVDPLTAGTLYAGFDGAGVFKSEDGAAHWSALNAGLLTQRIRSLTIDPQQPAILYAGTGDGGVYRFTHTYRVWLPLVRK